MRKKTYLTIFLLTLALLLIPDSSAHAAEYGIPLPDLKKLIVQMVKYVAGLAILVAAISIPFQIGGVGAALLGGIKKLASQAGSYSWEKGGLKERAELAAESANIKKGIENIPFVGKKIAGAIKQKVPGLDKVLDTSWGTYSAHMGLGKHIATSDLKKQRRLDQIGAASWHQSRSKTDDDKTKFALRIAQLADDDTMKTMYERYTVDQISSKAKQLMADPEWKKIEQGQAASGGMIEDSRNAFGALKWLSLNAIDQERKAEATEALKGLLYSRGMGLDKYGNVAPVADPTDQYSALRALSNPSIMGSKENTIDESKAIRIINSNDINQALRNENINTSKADINISKNFDKYNSENNNQVTSVVKLLEELKVTHKHQIEQEEKNLSGIYSNRFTSGNIDEILNRINSRDTAKNIKDEANRLGMNEFAKNLDKLKLDANNKFEPSIELDTIKQALEKIKQNRASINQRVDNISSFSEYKNYNQELKSTSPEKQILTQPVINLYESVSQNPNFQNIVQDYYSSPVKNSNTMVEKIINSNADMEYKQQFFEGHSELQKLIAENFSAAVINQKIDELKLREIYKQREVIIKQPIVQTPPVQPGTTTASGITIVSGSANVRNYKP